MNRKLFKKSKAVKNIFRQDANRSASIKTGLAPGTLIFTGIQKVEHPFIRVVLFNENNIEQYVISDGKVGNIRSGQLKTWIDCVGLHDVGLIEALGKKFNISRMVLEDILNIGQMPKYINLDKGNFLTIQSFVQNRGTEELSKEQLSIYFEDNLAITFREDERNDFNPIYSRIVNPESRLVKNDIYYLVYSMLDLTVDNYLETAHYFESEIEKYEILIETRPDNDLKKEIFNFRRSFLYFFKMIAPLEEAISRFKADDEDLVNSVTKIYISDLLDHCRRLRNLAETYNEMIYMLYDLLHTEINYRSNTIITTLTVISAIFIPLTFIVGVYGMNFEYMPELTWNYGYYLIWAIMILFTISAIVYFRVKKWI